MPFQPDYLVVGHVTKDLYQGGYKIGGTATFSALTAFRLGLRTAIVTSVAADVDLGALPADIRIERRLSETSTTFQNIYHDGRRQQHLSACAARLTLDDVPAAWRSSRIVHLGPVAQEVDASLADAFPGALLGLTPQGWMRAWDERCIVHPSPWEPPASLLQRADVVILSLEDVGHDLDRVAHYAAQTRLLVLTAGWKGATVYVGGESRSFAAPPTSEVDPTGAGDIFAAACLSALFKTRDPYLAAQFANCVAAHSVERGGLDSIPTLDEIEHCRALFDYRI